MATGIDSINWLTKPSGAIMPRDMRLDTFEVNWERQIAEEVRYTAYVGVPKNALALSGSIDTNTLTSASSTNFKFIATLPAISKELLEVGTITVEILGSATDDEFPFSNAVISKTISTTNLNNSEGFQITHDNTDATLRYWWLNVVTDMGKTGINDIPCTLDVVYNGSQRRKVKSIIGTITTNHRCTVQSGFDTFIDQSTIDNPVFYVADNRINTDAQTGAITSRPMRKVTYTGTYLVDRVSADRGEGRSAEVVLALTQEGTWVDE